MIADGFCLFESELGLCGIAWSALGVCAVQLPERGSEVMRPRMQRRTGAQETLPPVQVAQAIEMMLRLLKGEPVMLNAIALDLGDASQFNRRVWTITQTIAPGETLTYGEVARRIGEPSAARAVGRALGENPCPIIVPCHRVLAAGGGTGGFSGGEGVETKMRLLSIERAQTNALPSLFDDLPLVSRPRRL